MSVTQTDWSALARRLEDARDLARDFAREARGHFGARLRDIRLFGSAARGDWQKDSDVDVLILLDAVHAADREWIADHATRLGVLGRGILLSTTTLPLSDFELLRSRERLFAREVDTTGMPL